VTGLLVGVLALQGDVAEHERALTACGVSTSRVRTVDELAEVDGLVIPGGESTTMSALATAFGLMEPLRTRIATGMPVYGSCAGMILLADRVRDGRPDRPSIGGLDVTVRRNAFGRQVDSFEAPVQVQDIPGPSVTAVFIRAPWVEEIGPGVEALGRVESGPAAGRIVAVREGALLATSFHPELTGDIRVHELFVHMVRAAA
jgi:5'-phosphate synthase pdxT subunit